MASQNLPDNLTDEFGNDMSYDLRQIYAKIVGQHMEDVAEARKADNYVYYFKNLLDLFTIVRHKFKDLKNTEKEFNHLVNEAVRIANLYSSTWTGTSKDSKESNEIENSLRSIEMFLYERMADAKMFGDNKYVGGF